MFIDEFLDMGLTQIDNGLYEYKDRYSSIWYEILRGVSRNNHLPCIGIFTASANSDIENSTFVGTVSNQYKFIGNATVVDIIMESIHNINSIIDIHEKTLFNHSLTQINDELLLLNMGSSTISQGTVVPLITVENSYNGTKAQSYSFGIGIINDSNELIGSMSFKKKIVGMRQIHLINANTTIESNIGHYIEVFNQNITDIIQDNFNKIIPPEDAMKSLKLIEKLGKKRYANVVHNLAQFSNVQINNDDEEEIQIPPINAWNMFLSIVTYSAMEENLNAKKMLENIAERTLVIPTNMINALNN